MTEPEYETLITPEQIETLEKLKSLPIETDEDYQKLGEMFGEDQ
jgi:phenylacetate-coenzyme A ligase PaaK-like adenylate-forming protein